MAFAIDVQGRTKLLPTGRRVAPWDSSDLERHLLQRSVGALAADRHVCADCGRTPLVGERAHLYDRAEIVCELCRPLRRGEPVSFETVRHSEFGHTVRVRRGA
ncbi:MAG: hypothetical protein ACR2ND_09680 [Solirubrobacteraceae bacterium]